MPKKKKPTIAKFKKKLDKLLAEYCKKRDRSTCQWCGKVAEGSGMHTSHVIPKSRGNMYRWNVYNVKCLCFHCHMNKWHKDPLEGAKWFAEKFPDRMLILNEIDKNHKLTLTDFEQIEKMLNDLIEQLKLPYPFEEETEYLT